jgi:glycosyltransferase involved in cell wall biosynthesis
MKDLLYIAYSFPPLLEANAILNGKITHALAEQGYRCHVVTILPETGTSTIDQSLAIFSHEQNTVHGYRSYKNFRHARASLPYHFLRKCFPTLGRLPDLHVWDYRRAYRLAHEIILRYKIDLVFSTGSPFSGHLLGLRLKKEFGLPWIVHYFEPWAEQVYIRGNRLCHYVNGRLERAVLERADAATFISEDIMDLAMAPYPQWREKAHIFPLGFYPPSYPETTHGVQAEKLIFRYIGNFYGIRTPVPLLQAVARLKELYPVIAEKCEFKCVGGVQHDVDALKCRYGIGSEVMFDPPVNYVESLRLMKTADVLMTIDAIGEGEVCLPSKLVDYVGARRPIWGMSPLGGPAERLVRETGGTVAAPNDIEGAVENIKTMWERYARHAYEPNRRFEKVYRHYSLEGAAKSLIDVLRRCLAID